MTGPTNAADREARIAEIRRQIAEGVYETPEKLEAALDVFLDRQEPAGDEKRPESPRKAIKPR
jgi:hypothetical protein